MRCLAPPSQTCCAWPFHVAPCRACRSLPCRTKPRLRRRTPPDLAYQACLSLPPSPDHVHARSRLASLALLAVPARIAPGLPCQPRLSRPRVPCLPIPAFLTMPAKPCGSSIAPGLVTPCLRIPAVPHHPCHACQSEPVLQHLAMPAAPSTPDPAMPSLPLLPCPRGRAHEALPAVPCPSPTTPSQPYLTSPSTLDHALPARTGLARPCLRSHACHALPAWPFRPDRAMPAAPILASSGHAFRTMPANPCHSARCLACRAISCQPRGCQKSRHHQHSRCEPPDRVEPQEAHKPRCQEQQQGQCGTVGGGVIHTRVFQLY